MIACGGGGDDSTPVPTTGSLRVTNNNALSVWFLYLSPVSSSSWGLDQLGASTIPSGGSFTISGITPGSYDCKAVLSNGAIFYLYNFAIAAGQTKTIIVPAGKDVPDAASAPEGSKPDTVVEGGAKEPLDTNVGNLEAID
jgi:hypothetical protein